jgi:sugar lactone lactonase YvrE
LLILFLLVYFFLSRESFVTDLVDLFHIWTDNTNVHYAILVWRPFNVFALAIAVWSVLMMLGEALRDFFKGRQKIQRSVMAGLILSGNVFFALYLHTVPVGRFAVPLFTVIVIWQVALALLPSLPRITEGRERILSIFLALTPGISDVLMPALPLYFLENRFKTPKINRLAAVFSLILSLSIGSAIAFGMFTQPVEYGRYHGVRQLAKDNFYSMQIVEASDRLFACDMTRASLSVFDLKDLSRVKEIWVDTNELQDVRFNAETGELYHFNRSTQNPVLMALDAETGLLKRRSDSSLNISGSGSARVAFDNASRTIVVTRENDTMWFFDRDTLLPRKRLDIADRNEYVLFDAGSRCFILSYFAKESVLRAVTPDGGVVREFPAQRYQGGLALSRNRKELYVAMPLRSMIYVYDTDTFHLQRKIRTVFGVRNMAYDESRAILVAASMVNGCADVIDAQTGRRLSRTFVGYYLREVILDTARQRAFMSSPIGGIYTFSY